MIMTEMAGKYPFIRILDNPARSIPAALNLGIAAARGEIIVRMDAHTVYAPDYITKSVQLLRTTPAACVGAIARARGDSYLSRAIALAVSSPFGAGNASYRTANKEKMEGPGKWVDTVYLGAWRKSDLINLGGYAEEWLVNEDYELNVRLRQAGGKILLSPQLHCEYFVRSTATGLVRQYFRYGQWRVKTLKTHPRSLQYRQLACPLLLLGLFLSAGFGLWLPALGMVIPLLYLAGVLLSATMLSWQHGWVFWPALLGLYPLIHLSWGTGFYFGLYRFGIPRFSGLWQNRLPVPTGVPDSVRKGK